MGNTKSIPRPQHDPATEVHHRICERRRNQMRKELFALQMEEKKVTEENKTKNRKNSKLLSDCLGDLRDMELNNDGLSIKNKICEEEVEKLRARMFSNKGSATSWSSRHSPEAFVGGSIDKREACKGGSSVDYRTNRGEGEDSDNLLIKDE